MRLCKPGENSIRLPNCWTQSLTTKDAKVAKEKKSSTAKAARDAKEQNSLTAKAAKE